MAEKSDGRGGQRPRLTLRKQAEMPLSFHYSREDRLSLPGAPQRPAQGGFFRKNRPLVITFANILLLVLVGFLVQRFLLAPANLARLGGYSVALRGVFYEQVVFATLTVKNARLNRAVAGEDRIYVRFSLGKRKGGAGTEGYFQSSELPRNPGEEIVLREAIPATGAQMTLDAEVRIGERSKTLSRDLSK